MSVKRDKKNYLITNKFSVIKMGINPVEVLPEYLPLIFILTKGQRLRLGYGLNVLNQAIVYAKNLGYSGVVVSEKMQLSSLIKNILDKFFEKGYIKKESDFYVFDSIIKK
jgi:hypothetical protein